jgi:hypothetical protein
MNQVSIIDCQAEHDILVAWGIKGTVPTPSMPDWHAADVQSGIPMIMMDSIDLVKTAENVLSPAREVQLVSMEVEMLSSQSIGMTHSERLHQVLLRRNCILEGLQQSPRSIVQSMDLHHVLLRRNCILKSMPQSPRSSAQSRVDDRASTTTRVDSNIQHESGPQVKKTKTHKLFSWCFCGSTSVLQE